MRAPEAGERRGLVLFDLDGTILRGPSVCELLAAPLGHLDEMKAFEKLKTERDISWARIEMTRWYDGIPRDRLIGFLRAAQLAPGAKEGIALLRAAGVEVGIASITWDFAVDWFARRLGVNHVLGTVISDDGTIDDAWPRHKAAWLRKLASQLEIPAERTAAVGDSAGDTEMLEAAAMRFFVGAEPPHGLDCVHMFDGDILEVARTIIQHWPPA
ncbi:MAG: HAD family hydrolase [Candidatus Binataceae bacterium]